MAPSGIPNSCGNTRSPALTGSQRQQLATGTRAPWRAEGGFLDEGTAHLDPQTEAAVSAALAGLGITTVIIAHRAAAVRGAQRAGLVAAGQLTELDGPPEFPEARSKPAPPQDF